MTLQTFAVAGPAWAGSDEEVADEDMTKTQLQLQQADHLISSAASFCNHHPIFYMFPRNFPFFPHIFWTLFQLHVFGAGFHWLLVLP